jgi:3-methylcrotonyl-CoA carboxylase alpha subunit
MGAAKTMSALFETILIANRGEIACRVIATCRCLGIRSVAVYSDADADSRHVRRADVAVHIGPSPARESYLSIDRILDAARKTQAQAIHPGYGFLAENADFADACAAAGIVFVGPPPSAIRAMGSKAAAKALMRQAGVPMTPGYDGPDQSPEFLERQAQAIGYPVMIKANAGGGGKGMRRVDRAAEFPAALASCRREAAAAFGDDSVLLEKCLLQPRHVEVQVFADTHGNVISLFERDCSVQRRHQKVMEEAPAPLITATQRNSLGAAARDAARAVAYVGAGTVEFLLDRSGAFHFMEMNTRLQVEHPVTEMITGLDLVEWQLRVAAGEPLPLTQDQLSLHGHSIEARIYAEDPAHDFLPSIGKLIHLHAPAPSAHVRVDTGVDQGDSITPFYDPMIAKLIVWDETRELALQRIDGALAEYRIVGVASNVEFLHRLVISPSFTTARLDTDLIQREHKWLMPRQSDPPALATVFAALALLLGERQASAKEPDTSPWATSDGWRLNAIHKRALLFTHGGRESIIIVEYIAEGFYRIALNGDNYTVRAETADASTVTAVINSERRSATVVRDKGKFHVFLNDHLHVLTWHDPLDVSLADAVTDATLLAPMPGRVIAQLVSPGQAVEKGAPLLILEAMKMECTIYAPAAGRVASFHFAVGDQVAEDAELLHFDRDPAAKSEK